MEQKFHVGERVRCVAGDSFRRGAGFSEGLEFTVTEVTHPAEGFCYFNARDGNGVYEPHLISVTQEEQEKENMEQKKKKKVKRTLYVIWIDYEDSYDNKRDHTHVVRRQNLTPDQARRIAMRSIRENMGNDPDDTSEDEDIYINDIGWNAVNIVDGRNIRVGKRVKK